MVDDDLAALVEKLARPKPFENLSFNAALRRVLTGLVQPKAKGAKPVLDGNALLAELMAAPRVPKKVPSPSAAEWAASVPELAQLRDKSTWKAICKALGIDTNGDSARRKLQSWVTQRNANPHNKTKWPEVPEPESET